MSHSFDHTVFPDSGMRILSATIHLLGSSIITYCLARCINMARIRSISDLKSISWARWCVMLVLLDSWLFVVSAGILIHGVGMSTTINACSAGIFLCIWLYDVSKLLIYCFLIEKVRAVWGASQPRLKSPVYLTCLFVMLPFFAIPIVMIVGRIAYFRTDGSCVIGLKPFSSISLLAYDLSINIFLNGMFLWPLFRTKFTSPRMRAVARRTLWAAGAALMTSIVNITILTVLHDELGWVCLGSCGTDVTLNAIVLFWVTSPSGSTTPPQSIRVPAQQSAPSHSKPGVEPPLPTPATANSHVVFMLQGGHVPRPSIHSPSVSSKALEAARQEMALEPPSSSLASFPQVPMETPLNPAMEQHARVPPGRTRSWRRLFGLPDPQKEKDVEVHISVVTQHEIELGSMKSSEKKQEDSESVQKVDPPNEW